MVQKRRFQKVTRREAKASGYGYEARLRGLTEPALAGFANVAEGFSHPANDFDVALGSPRPFAQG